MNPKRSLSTKLITVGIGSVAVIVLLLTMYLSSPSEVTLESASTDNASYVMGLIGNSGQYLQEERAAGITAKLFSLSWRSLYPEPGVVDAAYLKAHLSELRDLYDSGFDVILNLGMHDPPQWIHDRYDDTYYVNQFGDRYIGEPVDSGNVNFVFNESLRPLADDYIESVFLFFGTDFTAVRIGGGRYGELTYPPHDANGRENNYWAFDSSALRQSPVPDWRPGDDTSNNDARRFLDWYLDALTGYQTWQIETLRQYYAGSLMILYPSWGIRPGDIEAALETNLSGTSWAEYHGEIQRGFDFARQVAAIDDANVIVTTTWLDAAASGDESDDPSRWSPVKYLASLAADHPLSLRLFGENTGNGDVEDMTLAAAQMQRYDLLGMLWFREEQLFADAYADLDDYARVIRDVNGAVPLR